LASLSHYQDRIENSRILAFLGGKMAFFALLEHFCSGSGEDRKRHGSVLGILDFWWLGQSNLFHSKPHQTAAH